jgi:hypothetical protein
MISVLSLVVTILVAFVAPLVTWEVARRQMEVTAREAWMRDFRAEVAAYLSNYVAYKRSRIAMDGAILVHRAELHETLSRRHNAIRLLIAERGAEHAAFLQSMDNLSEASESEATHRTQELMIAAVAILVRERAATEADPGMWRALWIRLGLTAVRWRPWSQFVAWCRGRPRFPN